MAKNFLDKTGLAHYHEKVKELIEANGGGIEELTSNFNVWELETGVYFVAPNVTMTNYTMFYDSLTSLGVTADTSMASVTIQLAKAFLIVHNYYEGMGMVEFNLFMMGEVPATISGMTMYQDAIAMGGTVTGGNFMIFSKLQNYQEKLVSGSNIKTINNQSLLGNGNITIEGGSSSGGIEELTSPIRIWDLTAGYYKIPASSKIYYYGSSNTSNSFTVSSASTLMVANYSSYKYYFIVGGSTTNNHIYYGYCSSGTGTYTNLELNDIKTPTSTLAQYNLGYYSTTSTITNLDSTNYVNPGMYGMSINSGTGVPSEVTQGSQAILNVLVGKQKPSGVTYIRQDLYVPSLNKHWKRNVYFNGSSYTYPEWDEIKENTDKIAIELTGVNSSSNYDCFYFPATGMVWFSMYSTGLTTTASSRTTVATVPEGYRPSRRTALATDELQDATANIKASVTSAGEITLLTGVAKASGDDQYISGWWYVPTA